MNDTIRREIRESQAVLDGLILAMDIVSCEGSKAVCVEEYRKELFRLHQVLGKLTGALDREQSDIPAVPV